MGKQLDRLGVVSKYDHKPTKPTWYKQIIQPATQFEKEVCAKCIYSDGTKDQQTRYCLYILRDAKLHPEKVSHRRPCKYQDCVKEGVFKPKKRVRPETVEKIRKKYKKGWID